MGREIFVEVIRRGVRMDAGASIFHDYVCGRDEGTNFVANYIVNSEDCKEEEDVGEYTTFRKGDKRLQEFRGYLSEYINKDKKLLEEAEEEIDDLREARRHTTTLEDFDAFTVALKSEKELRDEYKFSRSQAISEFLDEAEKKISEDMEKLNMNSTTAAAFRGVYEPPIHPEDYDIRLILSE